MKAQQFGLREKQRNQEKSNYDRLISEFHDLSITMKANKKQK